MSRNRRWNFFVEIIRRLVDYYTRRQPVAGKMIAGGATLMTGSLIIESQPAILFLGLSAVPAKELMGAVGFIVGLVLVVSGGIISWLDWRSERQGQARRKVFIIEQRGLNADTTSALVDGLSAAPAGRRESILLDTTAYFSDGQVVAPERAVQVVGELRGHIAHRMAGLARSDVSLVYGGVAPVPLAFLAGALMDDDGRLEQIYDWDRFAARWRLLDGVDDGQRFGITGLNDVPDMAPEVAVVVSVSYRVDIAAVQSTLGAVVPLVDMRLPDLDVSNHWAAAKQQALAQQFQAVLADLGNRGAGRVHLFIAAQNSVVFRLGTTYDGRTLPPVLVHQHQPRLTPPHPWAVEMPHAGRSGPVVVRQS